MRFFKITTLVLVLFTGVQSYSMQFPNIENWTEQTTEEIMQLSDQEVIRHWKAFWLQMKPEDIFGYLEEDLAFIDRNAFIGCRLFPGSFNSDFRSYVAERFEKRLSQYHPKNTLVLGKKVLCGLMESDMFMDGEPTFASGKSKHSDTKEQQTQQPILTNNSQDNNSQNNDIKTKQSFQSLPDDKKDSSRTTIQANYFPTRMTMVAGVVVIGGLCCWVYKKYQAYKETQKESEQDNVAQSENENKKADLTIQKNK